MKKIIIFKKKNNYVLNTLSDIIIVCIGLSDINIQITVYISNIVEDNYNQHVVLHNTSFQMTCHSVFFYNASFVIIIYLHAVCTFSPSGTSIIIMNIHINCLIICYMSHITINVLFLFLYSLSVM